MRSSFHPRIFDLLREVLAEREHDVDSFRARLRGTISSMEMESPTHPRSMSASSSCEMGESGARSRDMGKISNDDDLHSNCNSVSDSIEKPAMSLECRVSALEAVLQAFEEVCSNDGVRERHCAEISCQTANEESAMEDLRERLTEAITEVGALRSQLASRDAEIARLKCHIKELESGECQSTRVGSLLENDASTSEIDAEQQPSEVGNDTLGSELAAELQHGEADESREGSFVASSVTLAPASDVTDAPYRRSFLNSLGYSSQDYRLCPPSDAVSSDETLPVIDLNHSRSSNQTLPLVDIAHSHSNAEPSASSTVWRSALVGAPRGSEDLWRVALVGRPPSQDSLHVSLLHSQSCSSFPVQQSQRSSPLNTSISTTLLVDSMAVGEPWTSFQSRGRACSSG